MTHQAHQAIQATVDKLRDLAEKGRGSEHFEKFGNYEACPLCKAPGMHLTGDGPPVNSSGPVCCPVFGDCMPWDAPCVDYAPPRHRIIFDRIVYFTEDKDTMSLRTFKAWCLSAADDIEKRFLKEGAE